MSRIFLLLCRRYIIKKLSSKGYQKSSINKIMTALDLSKTGIPEYENKPAIPKQLIK